MPQLRMGNVIRPPDDTGTWIVIDVHDYGEGDGANVSPGKRSTVDAVAFDAENESATQPLYDCDREVSCFCDDPEECVTCHGSGKYTKRVTGWSKSTVLAPHVQAFIMSGMKKAFGLR